jgi:hypothetical protein
MAIGVKTNLPPTQISPATLLKPVRAAAFLDLSQSTLAKWRMSGAGPRFIKFGTAVRYDIDELRAYAASRARRSTSSRERA